MLFIYFISKALRKVALTPLGLEGRSCWALLEHPSSLSPRVCPEEPQTQSPFCLYTETINIKTSLQTLPGQSCVLIAVWPASPIRPASRGRCFAHLGHWPMVSIQHAEQLNGLFLTGPHDPIREMSLSPFDRGQH